SGLFRIRSPLAGLVLCMGLAMAFSHRGTAGRWLSQISGFVLIMLVAVTYTSTWLPGLDLNHIGFRLESNYIAHLFTLLIGVALILLPRLPEQRAQLLDRLTVSA